MGPGKNLCQQGFSLIETIVAIVIITVGLLTLAHLLTISIVMHERTESDLKAVQLAQGKMESLKAQFNTFMTTGSLPGDLSAGSHGPETIMIQANETDAQNLLVFEVNWNITDMSGGIKQVTLSVNPATSGAAGEGYDRQSSSSVNPETSEAAGEGYESYSPASVNPVTITSVLAP